MVTTTRPTIAILSRLPNNRSYRCVDHFASAETFDRIAIMRMDAQFFFGNVNYLKENIYKHVDENESLVALVLDASSMNALDSTAADTYEEIMLKLRSKGVEVMISHAKGVFLKVMQSAGLLDALGDGHVFYEVEDAVAAALRHRDEVDRGPPREEEDFGPSDMLDRGSHEQIECSTSITRGEQTRTKGATPCDDDDPVNHLQCLHDISCLRCNRG